MLNDIITCVRAARAADTLAPYFTAQDLRPVLTAAGFGAQHGSDLELAAQAGPVAGGHAEAFWSPFQPGEALLGRPDENQPILLLGRDPEGRRVYCLRSVWHSLTADDRRRLPLGPHVSLEIGAGAAFMAGCLGGIASARQHQQGPPEPWPPLIDALLDAANHQPDELMMRVLYDAFNREPERASDLTLLIIRDEPHLIAWHAVGRSLGEAWGLVGNAAEFGGSLWAASQGLVATGMDNPGITALRGMCEAGHYANLGDAFDTDETGPDHRDLERIVMFAVGIASTDTRHKTL